MELTALLTKLKMDHLEAQVDAVCEQAAQRQDDYKTFLTQALQAEWQGRYQRGIEARLRQARFPWIKTIEQFDFHFGDIKIPVTASLGVACFEKGDDSESLYEKTDSALYQAKQSGRNRIHFAELVSV